MALASNIVRRPGSARYYVRVAVPKKLQAFLGKKEVWKSLGTSDPHVARAKALPVMPDDGNPEVTAERVADVSA